MLGVPLFATMEPSPSRATSSSRGRKESETASTGTTGRPTSSRGRFPAVEPDFVPPYDRESLWGLVDNRSCADLHSPVVLLDNQMPKYSGHDVVSILRQMQRRDFVVGLTGDAMPADQDRFRQAGVDE
jgi:CheY-like chemotaxis protein